MVLERLQKDVGRRVFKYRESLIKTFGLVLKKVSEVLT